MAGLSLNKVLLIGNLTRDPELRYIPSGTAVVNFSIAVNRYYTTPDGERKEETAFVRIVAWGKQAENCGEYLSKGRKVFVEGRIQSRSWETESGEKRSAMEVRADRVQFLGGGQEKVAEGEAAAPEAEKEVVIDESEVEET